ncbi:MAG: FAD:protein FMN transferase [Rhodobacteraceae bacterium]|nr:FAD:protein FMN transferase [Paracoccaceae bacterium]
MRRRRFLQIVAVAACLPGSARGEVLRRRFVALGADAEILVHGPAGVATAALAAAGAEIAQAEALFSLYRPDSALSRLNAAGRLDDPPAELLGLLRLCGRVHAATGGRFDPTVQPLWRALAEGRDPAPARAALGWDRVSLSPGRIALGPGQALTLNGIAQGWATDRVTEALARHGLTKALVNIGEHRAIGGPFRLGLEDPVAGLLGHLTLENRAVATSSPGALTLPDGSAHILDPLEGRPPVWSTVCVSARSAALADGLSTALCHAPRDGIAPALARLGGGITVRLVDAAGSLTTL